jgi:hypothetical protein
MRGIGSGIAVVLLLAGCAAAPAEPSEDDLRQALARRGGFAEIAAQLTKGSCRPVDDGRYECDYALPDCPPFRPRCTRTRMHRARFAEVAGGWQYVGTVK